MTSLPPAETAPADLAQAIAERLVAGLGNEVRSVIGHGSWVHGDFCPGRSDLDLIVALRQEPDPGLLQISESVLDRVISENPLWRERLEIGFVTRQTIESVLSGDEHERFVARVSPGEPFHLVTADRHVLLDWDAAYRGKTIYGIPATEVLPAIPDRLVREVVLEHLRHWPGWLAAADAPSAGFQAYAVLTVSRAAAYLATGQRISKLAGAAWVADHHPARRRLTDWAVDWWYADGADGDQPPAGVADFVQSVAATASDQ